MKKELVYITGNAGKVAQVKRDLNFPFEHQKVDVPEIQSVELLEIVEYKAKAAFEKIRKPVLVDDVSLRLNALHRLPGPFIRFFVEEIGAAGICKLLEGYQDRSSVGEVAFAFYDGKLLKTFYAQLPGSTPDQPRGQGGFGWDAVFVPQGSTKTYAEMDDEERSRLYVRRLPMQEIKVFLEEYLGTEC